ncbi:MAG: undecaprenyldiphospho-muramoylpentapeptide beta-N-acetylglucosaminyltransferase [Candidatus Omnitrophica bacterium]|nr:undecaprenyldiphospho-muramoylpentapeptide beta-N-acetylglucosaminyltransferase [Candidatus Omnitrophota bacterium]
MRVLLVTGSSGGHIFPAMALMERLKAACADVLMVLPKKNSGSKIASGPEKVKYIHGSKLGLKSGSKNIIGAYFFLLGAWEGLRAIIAFRPDVVVGFGSLDTVALLFWAWLFRIKTVIHEQNVSPGRANRLLAKFADKVAVSFAQTGDYFNVSPGKIVLTGNPLRKGLVRTDRKQALDFFGFKEGKFNILVMGGSQGSHKLNTVCSAALSGYQKRDDLQLVHIAGDMDFAMLKQAYAQAGIAHKVFSFFPDMQYAYSMADLVICRAGATTIAELGRFAVPALLIPYPYAYAHQLENAKVLEESGAALIVRDEELCVDKIGCSIRKLMAEPQKLEAMRQAHSRAQLKDAACLLAEEVLNLN